MARTKQTARISTGAQVSRRRASSARMVRILNHKWKVKYIKDCKTDESAKHWYRVVWKTYKFGKLPETWEPGVMLQEDGFADALNVVDEWVDTGRKEDFQAFVASKYPSVAGANENGTCMFKALQIACELLGDSSMVPNEQVAEFMAAAEERKVDVSCGVSWKVFRAFVTQLKSAGSCLSKTVLDKNLHCSGHRGVEAILRLELVDGVYFVAALNLMSVGHAFILKVAGKRRTVYDDIIQMSLSTYGEWIERVMFVRKVEIEG